MNSKFIEEIEDYLNGKMENKQFEAFEKRMKEDELFFKQVQYQMALRDWLENRELENGMRQHILESLQELRVQKRKQIHGWPIKQIRSIVQLHALKIAMSSALLVGLFFWWQYTPKQGLLLSTTIESHIPIGGADAFGDGKSERVDQMAFQIYRDKSKKLQSFTLMDDTLKLYNVNDQIETATYFEMRLSEQGQFRLRSDYVWYILSEKEIGIGTIKPLKPAVK